MIPTLTTDEKAWQDRQTRRWSRRSIRKARWQLIRNIAAPILFIIGFAIGCHSCGSDQPAVTLNSDSLYLDSLLQEHSRIPSTITSDTADPGTQREYDSLRKAEYGDSLSRDGEISYLHHDGHIVASRPNASWFWIVFDSAGYKAARLGMEARGDSSSRKEEWRSKASWIMVKRKKEVKP